MDMDNQAIPKPSCTKWVIRIVFLLLQLAPVLRCVGASTYLIVIAIIYLPN